MIEVCGVGGYSEVGRNMTAVKIDDEVVIFDMGLHLDSYIDYTQDEDIVKINVDELRKVGAIPDDNVIEKWKDDIKAIVISHAHLDHVGALIFMVNQYQDVPIYCSPYTAEVIKAIQDDEKIRIKNPIKVIPINGNRDISDKIKLEFMPITHSIPHTVIAILHTKDGIIMYANDFKLDEHPTMGNKPDYKKLEALGKKGVKLLIMDSLGSSRKMKTPSESVAKEMLRDVLLDTPSEKKAIVVTTFSSHIARLRSIVNFGQKMGRKVVFLGRSLSKYTKAAENIGLINFSKNVEIVKYRKQVKNMIKKMFKKGIHKYLIVVTGHQGEPKSVLSRMIRKDIPFKFKQEDHVIFSSSVIPSPVNIENRQKMEELLHLQRVRIFKDIHVSGHASLEDHRYMLNMLKPKNFIPTHGGKDIVKGAVDLAVEKGYKLGKNVHVLHDGKFLKIQ